MRVTARTLFWKVFLWFWLANTLVVGALVLVVWLVPFIEVRPTGSLAQLHGLQVAGALAVLEDKGQAAFEQHARELEVASGFRTYWLDPRGNDLFGQSVPQRVAKAISEHGAQALREGRPIDLGPPNPIAIPLKSSSGEAILALAEPLARGPKPYFEQLVSSSVFLLWVLAVVVTGGLGCYALALYLTSPLRRLQRAVQLLGAGNLSVQLDDRLLARGDEIGELGRDFDRMARQVGALLISQKRLLRDVSHELRSPLARLYLALGIATRDAGPTAAPALERVGREAERINELIGQLLTLARLDAADVKIQQMNVELDELVREVAADADFEGAHRSRRVSVVRCDRCRVKGTPDLLRSAVENVMRNAIRHTPEGSTVEISLKAESGNEGGFASVEIRDRGPGVPEKLLERIFEPFYRVSDARERDSGGMGLGLAITGRAVKLHGGTVRASNDPDGGLIVKIELPRVSSTLDQSPRLL